MRSRFSSGRALRSGGRRRAIPNVDYVMTFEELGALLAAMEIDVISLEPAKLDKPATSFARNFARSCGVSEAILQEIGADRRSSEDRREVHQRTGPQVGQLIEALCERQTAGQFC